VLTGINVVLAGLLFIGFDRGRLLRGAGQRAEREARREHMEARRRARAAALAVVSGEGAAPEGTGEVAPEGGR
jgi:hypothetical protein